MTAKENRIKVAIASDFLTAFSRIPRTQQARVLEFINKFHSEDLFPPPLRVKSHENQRLSGSTDRVAQALLDPPLSDSGFLSV